MLFLSFYLIFSDYKVNVLREPRRFQRDASPEF